MPEKTALITGCSHGGLGAAMAKAYHARGFKVFATVRDIAKAGYLAEIQGIEISNLKSHQMNLFINVLKLLRNSLEDRLIF